MMTINSGSGASPAESNAFQKNDEREGERSHYSHANKTLKDGESRN